jgi:threonyl-tRNA synthetase
MPERFDLEYVGADNAKHRLVIIHRAPFGSMERFISILIEHYAGNFPFWLAPTQVTILPIADAHHTYATDLAAEFEAMGLRVHVDTRNEKINRKVAESEQKKVPYALIVGSKEIDNNAVSVRVHGKGDQGQQPVEDVKTLFRHLNVPGAS